jgi:hypothetical protein
MMISFRILFLFCDSFITYYDLENLLGGTIDSVKLETMWTEGVKNAESTTTRITFNDFKLLMKGQTNDSKSLIELSGSFIGGTGILPSRLSLKGIQEDAEVEVDDSIRMRRVTFQKARRSLSYDHKDTSNVSEESSLSLNGQSNFSTLPRRSSIGFNKTTYRKNREMRLGVLDASKMFDTKRNEKGMRAAGLIMKRGVLTPAEIDDAHNRALFGAAARKCGRNKTRNKTKSDVTEFLDARVALKHPI